MAITIESNPQAITPSDNPIRYTFNSNQVAQPNFFYRVKTYYNGNIISVDDVFPQSNGRGYIDISKEIMRVTPLPSIKNSLVTNSGTMGSIKINVAEFYGATPVQEDDVDSATTKAFKACLSDAAFLTTDFATDFKNTRFLTNYPRGQRIPILRNQDTGILIITEGSSQTAGVRAYDVDGNFLGGSNTVGTVDIRQFNLKASIVGSVLGGGVDMDDVSYIEIKVASSETLTFEYFDNYCYKPHSLLWLNEYGGYDTFMFEHNLTLSGDVKREGYKKQFGRWIGNGFVYGLINSGSVNYSSNQTDKGQISTDYITQELQNFLTETYKSPVHILYPVSGAARPIKILGRSFDLLQSRFEDLISEEIDFEYSNTHKGITL